MERKYSIILLLLVSLTTFYFTSGLLKDGYPSGGDNVSHYDLLLNTKETLSIFFHTGELKLWNADYYMGFPMFFFYTPLPYVTLALLSFLHGIDLLFLFKLSLVLFFSILPFLFYFSAQLMEFEEAFALGTALFSTALSSALVFGLEYYSFFATGLYAQLWGIVFLPFAIAFAYRCFVLRKKDTLDLFLAVLFLCLTFLSHIFTGVAAFFLVFFVFVSQLFQNIWTGTKQQQKELIKQYLILVLFFFLSISFFVIPYLLNQDYFGNITFDSDYKEHGYGINQTAHLLLTGDLLDYSFSFSRIPILTALFFLGIALSLFWKDFRQKYPALPLFLLLSLLWSLICIAGTVSFRFLSLLPVLSSLQTFRFIILFHFAALSYIGISIFWLVSFVKGGKNPYFVLLLFALLLIPVFSERVKSYQEYGVTYILQQNTDYWTLVSALQKSHSSGRLYVTSPSGLYDAPQHLQALPFLTGKPIFASAGVGGHDSLNAYYSSLPIISDAPYLVDILGIDAIIDKKQNADGMTLYKATNASGYFALGTAPITVAASAVAARDIVVEWLFSPLPLSHVFLQIDPTASVSSFSDSSSSSAPVLRNIVDGGDVFLLTETGTMMAHTIRGQLNLANASPLAALVDAKGSSSVSVFDYFQNNSFSEQDCGAVLQESQKKGYASTTVSVPATSDSLSTCYVIYKMTYHPEWHVFVDGVEEKLIMMSPSFMGAAVPSGTHDVVFSYEVFWYRKWLLLISVLSLVGLFWIGKRVFFKVSKK
ncbi:hypothetical protein HZA99_02210 [Candidatus Woesearchaeota archaeon]|nr:hypothetical protein [Candidatus Woesearchaeota archaeon]